MKGFLISPPSGAKAHAGISRCAGPFLFAFSATARKLKPQKPSSCRFRRRPPMFDVAFIQWMMDGSVTSSYIIYRVAMHRRQKSSSSSSSSSYIWFSRHSVSPKKTTNISSDHWAVFGCPLTLALRDGLSHTRSADGTDLNLHENSSPSKILTKSP